MLNGLDPNQDLQAVGPGMGPNCLQKLITDDKVTDNKGRVNDIAFLNCVISPSFYIHIHSTAVQR